MKFEKKTQGSKLMLSFLYNGPTISQAQSNISRKTAQGKDLAVVGKARWGKLGGRSMCWGSSPPHLSVAGN